MKSPAKRMAILGIRGLPAKHGGFETFAESLAPYMGQQGWKVRVYCQTFGEGPITKSKYKGIELIHVPIKFDTPIGTILFDWKSTQHACRENDLLLTLGYNTGFLTLYTRLKKLYNVINMDGLEWKRSKWPFPVKVWFFLNELIACWMGNHLIADHPEIKKHLARRVWSKKISVIPYGADRVNSASKECLKEYNLSPLRYSILIARPEPENMVLEIVQAYSRKKFDCDLVVLGELKPEINHYHRKLLDIAGPRVKFLGAIYDKDKVQALRLFCKLYIHGHTVGGTNPSLVEALGAGCPVLAHDNRFNRWVTDNKMQYFKDVDDCEEKLSILLANNTMLDEMRINARKLHQSSFQWEGILQQYHDLFKNIYLESIIFQKTS